MKKTINNKLFANEDEKIREYNINVIKNKEYKKISFVYVFYNPLNNIYYCSNHEDFTNYFKTKFEIKNVQNDIMIFDYETNKTFITCDYDFTENKDEWINGKINEIGPFLYYKDNDTEKYYIDSITNEGFNICIDYDTNEYINIDDILKIYKYKNNFMILIKYNNELYMSEQDFPNYFYKIEKEPKNDYYANELMTSIRFI